MDGVTFYHADRCGDEGGCGGKEAEGQSEGDEQVDDSADGAERAKRMTTGHLQQSATHSFLQFEYYSVATRDSGTRDVTESKRKVVSPGE